MATSKVEGRHTVKKFVILALLLSFARSDSNPTLSCPKPVEKGATVTIYCTEEDSSRALYLILKYASRSNGEILKCYSNSCNVKEDTRFSGTIEVTNGFKSMALTITDVNVRDAGQLVCVYDERQMSEPCQLEVYVVPTKLKCSHTFYDTQVIITCEINDVYPQATCKWIHNGMTIQGRPQNQFAGMRNVQSTTCSADLNFIEAGNHEVSVQVFPSVFNESDPEFNFVRKTTKVEFDIELLEQLRMRVSNGVLTETELFITEHNVITVTCSSVGGSPKESRITLKCGDKTWHDYNQIATSTFRISRSMNRKMCQCSAKHISGQVVLSENRTIVLTETPKKPVLQIDNGIVTKSYLILKSNEWIKFQCSSIDGKPAVNDIKIDCPFYTSDRIFYDTASYDFYVTRSLHGKQCTCSVGHLNLKERLNTSLIIHVTVVPQEPVCDNDFNTTHVNITCSTSKVVPQANCILRFSERNYPFKSQSVRMRGQHNSYSEMIYSQMYDTYNTTCSTSLPIEYSSIFIISVEMYPDLHMSNLNLSFVTKRIPLYFGPAQITRFTVVGAPTSQDDQVEVTAGSRALLLCRASGNPPPSIMIKSTDTYGENQVLAMIEDFELNHYMNFTCNKTGTYTCSVKNRFNTQSVTRSIHTKIKCKAEYYNTVDPVPCLDVPLYSDFPITLSVRVYPKPKRFFLYKVSPPKQQKERMEVPVFKYTNEHFSLGELSIVMKLLSPEDYGVYSLSERNKELSTIYFNLTAKGPPLCPTDVIIQNITTNLLTISWRPGFNGGLRQTFSVISHNPVNNITNSFQVEETSDYVMMHNLTGLSEGTLYILSVQTENIAGKTKCPHLNINETTTFAGISSESSSPIAVISCSVIGLLLFFTLVTIAVIIMRRRRHNTQPVSVNVVCNSGIKCKQPREQTIENSLYTDGTPCSGGGDLNMNSISKGNLKTFRMKDTVNRHFKIESADKGEVYANVVKVKSGDTKTNKPTDCVYNNLTSSNLSKKDVKTSNINAVVEQVNASGQDDPCPSGRTVSPEGLTYVSVVVDRKSNKFKIDYGKENEANARVEYMDIAMVATAKEK